MASLSTLVSEPSFIQPAVGSDSDFSKFIKSVVSIAPDPYLKAWIYGEKATGKTTLWSRFLKKPGIIMAPHEGAATIEVVRYYHPNASIYEVPTTQVMNTNKLLELQNAFNYFIQDDSIDGIVVESADSLVGPMLSWFGIAPGKHVPWGDPNSTYAKHSAAVREFYGRAVLECPKHFIVTSHIGDVKDATGVVRFGVNLPGALVTDIINPFPYVLYTFTESGPTGRLYFMNTQHDGRFPAKVSVPPGKIPLKVPQDLGAIYKIMLECQKEIKEAK